MKRILAILILAALTIQVNAQTSLTAKEIIKKAEDNTRGVESSYSVMKITTVRPKWSREMTMKSWGKGNDYSLIKVLSPSKDKGTAFLKRKKEVWNWMPTIERTIKLPPSMMSQSWMGTDLTNDDLVRESSNVTDYTHTLIKGDFTVNGRPCYKIKMIPKEDAPVVWSKVIVYIDKEHFIQLKSLTYDEDNELVTKMISSNLKKIDGRTIATKMVYYPMDKKGNKTVMEIIEMKFDIAIEESFFTLQNMKKSN